MRVLVDSTVWSNAFRRTSPIAPEAAILADLIQQGLTRIIGPVRQEVLSGIRTAQQFNEVRDKLRAFPDVPLRTSHFELAATIYNACRSKGVQGSNTDFLICAVSELEQMEIFTLDRDFDHFARVVPIRLFDPRTA